jgi:growth arrest-specific protein 1
LACKPAVDSALRDPDGLSCLDAEMVCEADAPCGEALRYYKDYCRKLFHGLKCSRHCRNSLLILRRQEKALPLTTCRCDGTESYDCPAIRANVDRLCFPPTPTRPSSPEDDDTSLDNQLGSRQRPAVGGDLGLDDTGESDGDGSSRDNQVDEDYGDYAAGKKVQFPYSVSSSPSRWSVSLPTTLSCSLLLALLRHPLAFK